MVFVKSMQTIDISEIRQKIQSHNVLHENGNGGLSRRCIIGILSTSMLIRQLMSSDDLETERHYGNMLT